MKKNKRVEIDKNKIRKKDILEIRANNNKIKRTHRWKPKITLNEGLRKTI